jgi:hypothetical protein
MVLSSTEALNMHCKNYHLFLPGLFKMMLGFLLCVGIYLTIVFIITTMPIRSSYVMASQFFGGFIFWCSFFLIFLDGLLTLLFLTRAFHAKGVYFRNRRFVNNPTPFDVIYGKLVMPIDDARRCYPGTAVFMNGVEILDIVWEDYLLLTGVLNGIKVRCWMDTPLPSGGKPAYIDFLECNKPLFVFGCCKDDGTFRIIQFGPAYQAPLIP